MKKSTIAVAALLTALSTVPVMSVAYAEDPTPTPAPASDNATQGTDNSGNATPSTDTPNCSANCCGGKTDE